MEPIKLYVGDQPLHLDTSAKIEIAEDNPLSERNDFNPHGFEISCDMEVPALTRDVARMLNNIGREERYPRKLKKALGQWWTEKRRPDGGTDVDFHNIARTKWQRKANRMLRYVNGAIMIPLPRAGQWITISSK